MPVRRLNRDEWTARLMKCCGAPLQGKTKLNTAEWWRTDWGFMFTVPVDHDGTITDLDLQLVIADVMGSAPPGHTFGDDH